MFLVDVSGSMQDANKLPLLKRSLQLSLTSWRPMTAWPSPFTRVRPACAALDAGRGQEPDRTALDGLEAGGSTNGAEGIRLAYQTAARISSRTAPTE